MAYLLKAKDGSFIKYMGKHVLASNSNNTIIKAVDMEKRTLLLRGTDETVDRDGDITTHKGWKFENFYKNPVFMWAHDYSGVPLARILKIISRSKSQSHDFLTQFPTEGLNPFADMILSLYNEKVINASSVGFIPTKMEDLKNEDQSDRPYYGTPKKFLEKELLELSGCGVPSNPNAVQEAVSEQVFSGYKGKDIFAEYVKGHFIGLKHDDVLEELRVKDFQIIDEKAKKKYYNVTPEEGFKNFVETDDEPEESVNGEDKFKQFLSTFNSWILTLNDEQLQHVKSILNIESEDKNIEKSGAVLNKKNMTLLSTAVENINKVLESAKKEEPDPLKEPDDKDKKDIGDPITKDEVLKPFPGEHSCRLKQPNYDSYSRKNCAAKSDGKCIDYIYGIVGEDDSELQSMRFDKEIWTKNEAKNYCSDKDGTFEAAKEDDKAIEPKEANKSHTIYDEIMKDDVKFRKSPNQISQDSNKQNQERAQEATMKELCKALRILQSTIKKWK